MTISTLGVNYDENMNFSCHISEMCKRAAKKVRGGGGAI
jgi:hypothetical protein